MAHDDLWAGIELKRDHATFHYERMGKALRPAEPLPQNPALARLIYHRGFGCVPSS
jgi:hypothetical protein